MNADPTEAEVDTSDWHAKKVVTQLVDLSRQSWRSHELPRRQRRIERGRQRMAEKLSRIDAADDEAIL
jgi:hypothetical protein